MTTRPLCGITVVTVEQAVAAPLCTSRMVDAGARVIKVERASGDFARGYDDAAAGDSSYFAWTNHGKESVILDFKQVDDAALLERLIAKADVFVQNLAPGSIARAGFGIERLRAHYPKLITCSISGYGDSPAVADKKAYDLLVQAESGLIGISGGSTELGRIGVSICDIGTGITAYSSILEALVSRSASGQGVDLQVSLFDVAAEWMSVPYIQHVLGDGGPQRVGLRHPTIAPYGAFETSEGTLTLISIQNEREWQRLCDEVLTQPELATDSRFTSNTRRVANRPELDAIMAPVISVMSRDTFQMRLVAASIAFGTVSSLDDLVAHPALRQRMVTASGGSPVTLPAHPLRIDGAAIGAAADAAKVPTPGEHTDAIRKEFPA